jgi:hypothetical protein
MGSYEIQRRLDILTEAANGIISGRRDTYKTNAGSRAYIEDKGGGRAWIVSIAAMDNLERALEIASAGCNSPANPLPDQ